MKKGLFITFEGSDGAGKTTQIKLLKEFLEQQGFSPVVTREPGGTKIGELIRNIILDKENAEMSNLTEMLLYAASRSQHVDEYIRPNLFDGKIVISDRFVDSSVVYQGAARKLGNAVVTVNDIAIGDCVPDATFLLLTDPTVGFSRVENRSLDRIESEGIDYQRLVIEAYADLAKKNMDRIMKIEANDSVDNIHDVIVKKVMNLIQIHESDIC